MIAHHITPEKQLFTPRHLDTLVQSHVIMHVRVFFFDPVIRYTKHCRRDAPGEISRTVTGCYDYTVNIKYYCVYPPNSETCRIGRLYHSHDRRIMNGELRISAGWFLSIIVVHMSIEWTKIH